MAKILSDNRYYMIAFLLFLIAGMILMGIYPKGTMVLLLNQLHGGFWDTFFYYLTWLGDGLFYVLLVITLAFWRWYYALLGAVSYALSSLVAQFLKRLVFDDFVRPKVFFDGQYDLSFVEGVTVNAYFSFPSGHTATAFSIGLLLALIIRNKPFGLVLFLLSLLVGISRIYLVQHFFIDIFGGAVIGVVVTLISFYTIERSKTIQSRPWKDRSLRQLLRK